MASSNTVSLQYSQSLLELVLLVSRCFRYTAFLPPQSFYLKMLPNFSKLSQYFIPYLNQMFPFSQPQPSPVYQKKLLYFPFPERSLHPLSLPYVSVFDWIPLISMSVLWQYYTIFITVTFLEQFNLILPYITGLYSQFLGHISHVLDGFHLMMCA